MTKIKTRRGSVADISRIDATSSPIDIAVPLHGGDLNLTQLLSAARSGYVAAPTTVVAPRPGATPEPAAGNAPGISTECR